MEKNSSFQMDLDEWELVPDDGFLNGKKTNNNSKEFMEAPVPDVEFINEIGEAPKETTSHEEVISDALFYNKKAQDQKFADTKTAPEEDDDDETEAEAATEGGRRDDAPMKKGRCCWDGFGFSIWKWKLTGIGALCSIGVAAAATTTICMFIFGATQRQKQHHMNQKLPLKIYPDDKNLKEVIVQHATRLNHATMAAARGLPLSRANISFGGFYDGSF